MFVYHNLGSMVFSAPGADVKMKNMLDEMKANSAKQPSVTKAQWENLIDKVKCSNKGLMLLYNDTEAIEFGAKFNPDLVEIHSACLNDFYLLDALKNKHVEDKD